MTTTSFINGATTLCCMKFSYTKSNPNPNPTTKQHAIVRIQLNIVIVHVTIFS